MQNCLKQEIDKMKIKCFWIKFIYQQFQTVLELNGCVTANKILKATDATKLGKALGPDGFSVKFYKTLKKVVPVLQLLLNEAMKPKEILKSWNDENISLIPKEVQDLTNVKIIDLSPF